MKPFSKILSALLCFCMLLSFAPLAAFGSDSSTPPDTSSSETIPEDSPDSSAPTEAPDTAHEGDTLVAPAVSIQKGDDVFRLLAGVVVENEENHIDGYDITVTDTGGFDIAKVGEYTIVYAATLEDYPTLTASRKVEVVEDNPDDGASGNMTVDENGNIIFDVNVQYEGKAARARGTRALERITVQTSSVYTFQGVQEFEGYNIYDTAWISYIVNSSNERAYCVEAGVPDGSDGGNVDYNGGSTGGAVWNALTEEQRVLITIIIYYGRLNNDRNDEAVNVAIQSLIWEVALGQVSWENIPRHENQLAGTTWLTHSGASSNWSTASPRGIYNTLITKNGLTSVYSNLVTQIQKHYVVPSFSQAFRGLALSDANIKVLPEPHKNADGTYSETEPLILKSSPSVLATMNLSYLTADNPYIRVDISEAAQGIIKVWAKQPIERANAYCPSPAMGKIGFENPSPVSLLLSGTLPSGAPAQTKMVVNFPDPLLAYAAFATDGYAQDGFTITKLDADTGINITPIPMKFRVEGPAGFTTWEGQLPVTFKDIPSGTYTVTELEAPHGFFIGVQTSQTIDVVTNQGQVMLWGDTRQFGQIIVHKVDQDVYDRAIQMPASWSNDKVIKELSKSNVWVFPYMWQNHIPAAELPQGDASFKGAEFEIYANEDIIAPQRKDKASLADRPLQAWETLIYSKGDLVQTIITGTAADSLGADGLPNGGTVGVAEDGTAIEDHIAISSKLNLGKYIVKETKLPEGYLHQDYNPEGQEIEVVNDYTTQDVPVNSHHIYYKNKVNGGGGEVGKTDDLYREMAQAVGVHMAKYGVFHARTNTLMFEFRTDINGWGGKEFCPYGLYYIKEIEPSPHFYIDIVAYFFFAGIDGGGFMGMVRFDIRENSIKGELIVTTIPRKPRWKYSDGKPVKVVDTPNTGVEE